MSRTDDPERTASETEPRDDAGESLEAMMERADHAFAAVRRHIDAGLST